MTLQSEVGLLEDTVYVAGQQCAEGVPEGWPASPVPESPLPNLQDPFVEDPCVAAVYCLITNEDRK